MRTPLPSVGDGACYKRWNDDLASSFRSRDKGLARTASGGIKSLFNQLKSNPEVTKT
jgi:hypothetical protein